MSSPRVLLLREARRHPGPRIGASFAIEDSRRLTVAETLVAATSRPTVRVATIALIEPQLLRGLLLHEELIHEAARGRGTLLLPGRQLHPALRRHRRLRDRRRLALTLL